MRGMITFLIAALLGIVLVIHCSEALLADVVLLLLALRQLDWPVLWQWSQPVLWVVAYGFGALVLLALLDECLAIWRENSLTKKPWHAEDTKGGMDQQYNTSSMQGECPDTWPTTPAALDEVRTGQARTDHA